MKSAEFHEIRMKFGGFHWNLADFTEFKLHSPPCPLCEVKFLLELSDLKVLIHEICQISWNPVDFMWNLSVFMKSTGFHVWTPPDFMWNPPDFMKSAPKSTLCKKMRFGAIAKYRSFVYIRKTKQTSRICVRTVYVPHTIRLHVALHDEIIKV